MTAREELVRRQSERKKIRREKTWRWMQRVGLDDVMIEHAKVFGKPRWVECSEGEVTWKI